MKVWKWIFLGGVVLILSSCAKRGFPPGGPKDLTPPQVTEVNPANNSLKVDPYTEISLCFSERMDKERTEKSIFITPVPESPFEFKWKKNKLILKSTGTLEKDRTYVINLGTNAQDLHNNRMEKSYSFAFSTGEGLDSGFISGRVFFQSRKEKGVSVWTYPLSKFKEPDPKKDKPEYVTLSDLNGEYTLSYLRHGWYRLFAVKDSNDDLLWDPDKEPLGLTTRDLYLSDDSLSFYNIDFNLVLRDTTPPVLLDCQSLDKGKVRLEFDEPLYSTRGLYEIDNYKILSDSSNQDSLKVELVYTKVEDYTKVYLATEEMTIRKYTVYVQDLSDLAGNPIDREYNKCFFEGSQSEDKDPLRIIAIYPQSGASNIPLDAKIKLFFDKPPRKNSTKNGFVLEDSSKERIEGIFLWENPAGLVFVPDKPLQGEMKYELSLKEVVDLWDNPLADTNFKLTFSTLNPDTLGSISGRVENSIEKGHEIVIILEKIDLPKFFYDKKLSEAGGFKFEKVFPGKYNLKAYLDLNRNGILDLGKPIPFETAEAQFLYPDTLNIRPRWDTEDVILKLK